jgi:nucleolar protein 9
MGSRVFDALLDSPTVPAKMKRQFVMDFIGNYHILVDDKLGSRVGDRCWAFCDTYLKEKIARSLIPQEQFLASSFYGKFFARNLNLYLLQRRPEEWRNLQSQLKRTQEQQKKQQIHILPESKSPETHLTDTQKRKYYPENEIDALFNEKLGKRIKKAALVDDVQAELPSVKSAEVEDKDLKQILGAIRVAPANAGHVKKKRRT